MFTQVPRGYAECGWLASAAAAGRDSPRRRNSGSSTEERQLSGSQLNHPLALGSLRDCGTRNCQLRLSRSGRQRVTTRPAALAGNNFRLSRRSAGRRCRTICRVSRAGLNHSAPRPAAAVALSLRGGRALADRRTALRLQSYPAAGSSTFRFLIAVGRRSIPLATGSCRHRQLRTRPAAAHKRRFRQASQQEGQAQRGQRAKAHPQANCECTSLAGLAAGSHHILRMGKQVADLKKRGTTAIAVICSSIQPTQTPAVRASESPRNRVAAAPGKPVRRSRRPEPHCAAARVRPRICRVPFQQVPFPTDCRPVRRFLMVSSSR